MQVPWLRQGLEAHSLMLVWQLGPKVAGLESTLRLGVGWGGEKKRHAHSQRAKEKEASGGGGKSRGV